MSFQNQTKIEVTPIWSSLFLQEALQIKVESTVSGQTVHFNSKSLLPGDIFIAFKGSNSDGHRHIFSELGSVCDGHDYALDALQNGASIVILNKDLQVTLDSPKILRVNSTKLALRKMALFKRQKMTATHIIAVTGSVGKTTTKDALYTVLKNVYPCFGSRDNFNNELGLQLNLASMPENLDCAIFELGMNSSGELGNRAKILKPNIGIITNISEAHTEFFESMDHVVDAKCEIFQNFENDGIAIVQLGTEYSEQIFKNLNKFEIKNVYTFGTLNSTADSRLVSYEPDLTGQSVNLVYSVRRKIIRLKMPFLLPEQFAQNFAAVLLVVDVLGQDVEMAASHLTQFKLRDGRGVLKEVKRDGKKFKIICDYYNSSPSSLKAGLKYLGQVAGKKKIAIVGDMLELGKRSRDLHEGIVPAIVDAKVNKVFLVGSESKCIGILLPSKIMYRHFESVEELINKLDQLLEGDEIVYVKGSNSIRLNKVMEYFK